MEDLSSYIEAKPNSSEEEAFRSFVPRLMSLQTQVDTTYHYERLLCADFLRAVDIPVIKETLHDWFPSSSKQAI